MRVFHINRTLIRIILQSNKEKQHPNNRLRGKIDLLNSQINREKVILVVNSNKIQ